MNQSPQKTLPLGDFKSADQWQTHINSIFYGMLGPGIHDHFQTYVSLDHRLAHALADEYFQQVKDQPFCRTVMMSIDPLAAGHSIR